MKLSHCIYFVIATLLFSSCASKQQKENTLNFSGAFALYPLAIKWSEEYQKEHPDVRFNISAGGAGKGMADALSGTVDLGMFSREIEPTEKEKGIWWVGLCIDAVIPTISADNPYKDQLHERGLTKEEFRAIFIDGTITDWSTILQLDEPCNIEVYTRSDACGAAGTWASYLGGKQEDIKGVGIYGDPALAEVAMKNYKSIAYNNNAFIYDVNTGLKRPGIETIPIDINSNGMIDPEEDFYTTFDALLKAIGEGYYPSPPARELYFVAKGKPIKESTLSFIKWTLTDGQQFVKEAGYVPITQEKIDHYLKKLETK